MGRFTLNLKRFSVAYILGFDSLKNRADQRSVMSRGKAGIHGQT